MARYPKLEELIPRIEQLPETPFEYTRGHLTGAKWMFYPNLQSWAVTKYNQLRANPGDRELFNIYLELLELIQKWETRNES